MTASDTLAIVLLTAHAGTGQTPEARALTASLADECSQDMGLLPEIGFSHLSPRGGGDDLEAKLDDLSRAGHSTILVLPADTGLDIFARRMAADAVAAIRRNRPGVHVFYDKADPSHPLLIQAWVDAIARLASDQGVAHPGELGLLLAASGDTDPETRAESYKLMRLLWEQTGAAHGEVAFVRHDKPLMPLVLPELAARPLRWVIVPEYLFNCEHLAYARTVAADFAASRSEAPWPMTGPLAAHPNVAAWFKMRAMDLWWSLRMKIQKPAVSVGGSGLKVNVRPVSTAMETRPRDTF